MVATKKPRPDMMEMLLSTISVEEACADAHCFTASMGKFKKGEEKPLNNTCGVAICSDTRYISLMGCGVMGTTPPCYIAPGNLSKPYPHCCDILVCPHSPDE
ncbi:hypothetical protein HUJ04_005212 [Dendroctonus ponderosae]|nr:hypothetical protein HUJ04_005212 [Dendroctonus ponderosae]KAH1015560.1 hypothetical protein HUJ05_013268 [Dendroctonus ponderosae]